MTFDARRPLSMAALSTLALLLASAAHAERHYDCTKPANANKAVCKAAAPPPASDKPAAITDAARHYDCSKAGNANKAACKGATAPTPASTAAASAQTAAPAKPSIFSGLKNKLHPASAQPAAPAPAATTAPATPEGSYKGKSITADSAGATGQCKDGTYTHATHHSGACSSHGGVAKWMQ